MNLKINLTKLEKVLSFGISLDLIVVLKLVENGNFSSQSKKTENLYNTLIRKQLITENDKITQFGLDILTYIDSDVEDLIITKVENNEFDRWWKIFPATNIFSYNGVNFSGSRTLRQKEKECQIKFNNIVLEGEYTADTIIKATMLDIENKKKESVKTGENKLQYLQNSLTYLNQRTFVPYIDLLENIKPEEEYGINI